MPYTKTNWLDRIVQKPLTYQLQDNGDGTVTLIPAPGTITQEGTPINAGNLNKIEDAIVEAYTNKNGTGSGLDADLLDGRHLKDIIHPIATAIFNGGDGDVIYSANTTLTGRSYSFNNLTINAGVTLTVPSGCLITVKGTLILNGIIRANGAPGNTDTTNGQTGKGGSGGGIIILYVNAIIGTGTINASGSNGTAPTALGSSATTNYRGEAGGAFGYVAGAGGSTALDGSGGGTVSADLIKAIKQALFLGADWYVTDGSYLGGAGGANGENRVTTDCAGGGGGAGFVGNGSAGTKPTVSTASNGGAGGGGGGAVIVMSKNAIPAINITASGGGGTQPYNGSGGVGGNGGGGYVLVVAPSHTATLTASPGSGGAGAAGAGLVEFIQL